jgi:hypothetical protein
MEEEKKQKSSIRSRGTISGIVLYEVTKQRREYQEKYRWRNKRGLKVIAQ